MRGIPATGVFIFIFMIILLEILGYVGIIQLVNGKRWKRNASFIYWLITVLFLVIWLTAFLNPEKIRHTSDYGFFYFVIFIALLNLLPKAIISVFLLISVPFRLFNNKSLSKIIILSGLIISFGVILTLGYGVTLGGKTIRTEEVQLSVPALPESLRGLKIVHISDLHLGSFGNDRFLARCVKKINRIRPDLILFTGDIVNNFYQEMNGFEGQLKTLKAGCGKFAILGNHDYGDYSDWDSKEDKAFNQRMIDQKISDAGFQLLMNQSEKVKFNDTAFYITGVQNWGHKPFPQYADLDSAMINVPKGAFKILMTHDPAHWVSKVVPYTDIPLTLSGHTHGGQFSLKFAGIAFSPIYLVEKDWGGLYQEDHQYLYVNRGIGCVGLPGRIDMAPEITVLTLVPGSEITE